MTWGREKNKTKLVALRMEPALHEKLTKLMAAINQGRWSYGKTTISKLLCAAADDLTSGDQKNLVKIRAKVKERMQTVKKEGREVAVYNFARSSDVIHE